ncbi:transposase [Legionella pneumophila serogroup 1]|uniref:IS66 family transposase n=1 Tax=Legionella pneumophila TaxID=446 RepID=UPI00077098E5|nr:transposase [Legionella pneumophila]QIB23988.1 transposase [Legionella pneumophila]CZH13319.1 Transposase IS66 family [Legionella pneumophila]
MITTAPQSELGKALDYMHLRWEELTAYLLNGCLEIDNNLIENLIMPFALGRKKLVGGWQPQRAYAGAFL